MMPEESLAAESLLSTSFIGDQHYLVQDCSPWE